MKKLLVLAVTLVTAAGISASIATASPSRGAPVRDASCAAWVRASALAYFKEQERPTLDQALVGVKSSALRYLTAQEGLTLDQTVAGTRSGALRYFRAQEALTFEHASDAAASRAECDATL